MNLKNGNLTIGELLAYPPAKALLLREFPAMVHHPMLRLAGGMTLNRVIAMAGDALPPDKRRALWLRLEAL